MKVLLYAVVIVAGLASPVQAGATAALEKMIGRPFEVGCISAAGTVGVTLLGALLFRQLGFGGKAGEVPWWAWLSGLFGAVFILAQPVVGAKIGAGAYIGLVVTAATLASIVIDHKGWLRFEQRNASKWRIGGAVLMIVGVGMVAAS
ncbi:MAG: DMT family transporter [Gluconacetobacter diazotrophicus]|nr:DMT family transporter [Gluconacetobacter diazotrophicus]